MRTVYHKNTTNATFGLRIEFRPICNAEGINRARVRATPDGREMTPDDIQAADLSKLPLEQRTKIAPLLLDIAPGTDAAMLNKRRWAICGPFLI
jgi:hypothetical protein